MSIKRKWVSFGVIISWLITWWHKADAGSPDAIYETNNGITMDRYSLSYLLMLHKKIHKK